MSIRGPHSASDAYPAWMFALWFELPGFEIPGMGGGACTTGLHYKVFLAQGFATLDLGYVVV